MASLRFRLSIAHSWARWSLLGLGGVISLSVTAAEQSDEMSRIRLGQAVYSLYQQDPLATLTQIALSEQGGLVAEDARQAELMAGGVALAYGMTDTAQQRLNQLLAQSDEKISTQLLVRYWLSRLNFDQGRLAAADQHYRQLLELARAKPDLASEALNASHWTRLHYQASHHAMLNGDAGEPSPQLPQHSIEQVYLAYNRAVQYYSGEDYASARNTLRQAEARLQSLKKPADSLWTGWLPDWWSDPAAPSAFSSREYQALSNQVQLTLGQTLLAEGKLAEATQALGKIQGTSLVRDEALLTYGWTLTQADDWPMAMGIWQHLSTQPDNLYTLQAQHALAVGYAGQGGLQQARQTLLDLNHKFDQALTSLHAFSQQSKDRSYWLALAEALGTAGRPDTGSADEHSRPDWPAVHDDLLQTLVAETGADSGQAWLQRLQELEQIAVQLQAHKVKLGQFAVLIEERAEEHQRRVNQLRDQDKSAEVQALGQQAAELKAQLGATLSGVQEASDGIELLDYLSVLADESEQPVVERLRSARQGLALLADHRQLKPGYASRMDRLQGILLWQLHDSFPARAWQAQQAVGELQALQQQLSAQQQKVTQLMARPDLYQQQQHQVDQHAALVSRQLADTRRLQQQLVEALTQRTQVLLAGRQEYLQQQRYRSELALLQLNDQRIADPQPAPGGGHSE